VEGKTYTVEVARVEATSMNKLRVVVSLPNDNAYQHEQASVAKATGDLLGLELQVLNANDDSITQSQQLLEIIQSGKENLPSAFLVEPVTSTGLRRVAEAAVAQGIAWVISNSDVDYARQLSRTSRVPVFTVSQGQNEIGRLQGKQMTALLPQGGSVLMIEGPGMSSVAVQRHEGMETARPRNVQMTTLRSKWSEESAAQSVGAWLKLATTRAEKYHLIAGQTHELAMGARKAFQVLDNPEQSKKWLALPFIGIGISNHVKPLVDKRALSAAVITSVTMELALRLLVRALESKVQPAERSIVEVASYPELEKLTPKS